MPGSAVLATSYQSVAVGTPELPTAAASMGDVHMERSGSQRWLVVARPANELWDPVVGFWQDSGFLLTTEQRGLGILETDWAETRDRVPQDFLRRTLGMLVESAHVTGRLDRFRTRIEGTPNGTEIYISHRGMTEINDKAANAKAAWQPSAVDAELEAELLRRLMIALGTAQERTAALAASPASIETSRSATQNGVPVVEVYEGFERAWRRVGLALNRAGFTVEERDRSAGIYAVRYVTPHPDRKEPGLFSRLVHWGPSDTIEAPLLLRIRVKGDGEKSVVSVLNATGVPDATANAKRIVKIIADDLN